MNKDKILIVDDEADIALILKLQLEDSGFQTVRARDGIEALEQIAREKFSLILLDIKMPRMDGMQVLDRVRKDFPDLGVVMMTAHGSEAIAVEAMKKGAIVAQKTAGDLTDEGKRQYKIFSLKTKVHEGITDLGARVYALMGSRVKNPALDPQVKDIVANIKKLDAQIAELEGMPGPAKTGKKKTK